MVRVEARMDARTLSKAFFGRTITIADAAGTKLDDVTVPA